MDGITDSMDMSLSKIWELVMTGKHGVLQSMGHKELDTTEQLNSTELICKKNILILWSIQHLGHLSGSIK